MRIDEAKWIWENASPKADEHAEFFAEFDYSDSLGDVYISISADSEYGIFLNGKYFGHGQYPDYPHYKVYDKYNITDFLVSGKNTLAIEVWYLGNNCSTNIDDGAGLWFSVYSDDKTLLKSDESIRSRLSKTYRNYGCIFISGQLGYGYGYDSTKEDDWKLVGGDDFSKSYFVTPTKNLPDILRPIKTLKLCDAVGGVVIKEEHGDMHRYLLDFGKELVGLYRICFDTESEQNIEICYGEHIVDVWVRDRIHSRRFAFDYRAKCGKNDYFGYLRRLGLRYVELRAEHPISNIDFKIIPVFYPLKQIPFAIEDEELKRIYDICINTLRLCMHEHYEDCPWREQAMYVMDSRNQMICGYHAFGEYRFPRACLKLIAEDRREDGMLNITYPGASGLVIPSFGLHFYTAVREYGDYSGDWAFVEGIYPKLKSVLDVFVSRYSDQSKLINNFGPSCYWNFYEWAKDLEGTIGSVDEETPDLIINTLFSLALQNMDYICKKIGKKSDYLELANNVNDGINQRFKNKDTLLYGLYDPADKYSELGNSLAVLCGAADVASKEKICNELVCESSELVKITLSMKCFKYDALLGVNEEKYTDYILSDIRRVYRKMLDFGSTTVWETEKGERDFGKAGSLCHGWSAMPIYYFHKLLK